MGKNSSTRSVKWMTRSQRRRHLIPITPISVGDRIEEGTEFTTRFTLSSTSFETFDVSQPVRKYICGTSFEVSFE